MGKIFPKDTAVKGLLFKIHKDPLKVNNKKTRTPIKKYRWLTNTWKDAQHHSLSEKCKSKPQ